MRQSKVTNQVIEDLIEAAYWEFDARKKGYKLHYPQSERNAFKQTLRHFIHDLQQNRPSTLQGTCGANESEKKTGD